ncbi:MAG: VanZ family protein [Planctomycetaceae bacterium]
MLPESAWRESSTAAPASVSTGARSARRWGRMIFLCGVAFAVYGSLVPFNFEAGSVRSAWEWVQRIPHLDSFAASRADFFSNMCLFVPIGLGGMAWLTRNERSLMAGLSLLLVMALGLVLSLGIEAAQTMLPSRVASFADVVAQSIGGLLGCLLWIVFGPTVRAWVSRLQSAHGGGQRLELLLQGYLVLQFCLSVFPLDVTIHPADLYSKLQRGRINLIPFVGHQWNGELIAEMLFFSFTSIPYGALATRLWMTSRTSLRSVGDSLALGMAIVIGIELCQLAVASRFTDATQVVMGACGVSVGVLLMHALWPRGTARPTSQRTWLQVPGTWFFAAMLYGFIPAAFLLWPYEFVFDAAHVRAELQAMLGIPFEQLLRQSPLSMSTVITRDLLLYVPLGVLLGAGIRWTGARRRPLLVLGGGLVIMGIATGIEVLQALIPQRDPDITEVLLATAAGMLGMASLAFRPGALPLIPAHHRFATGQRQTSALGDEDDLSPSFP